MKTTAIITTAHDQEYNTFEALVRERIAKATGPFFTTDADPDSLWATYLDNLPADRQHYDCHACRRFIQKYGGLVTISDLECGCPYFLRRCLCGPLHDRRKG